MIIGVGNDLVEIERVRTLLEGKHGERFIQRVLTPQERELAQQRKGKVYEFVAGRFAAKEAVVKAVGCGIGEQMGFQDIEILPDRLGKPICTLSSSILEQLVLDHQAINIHISITHGESMALAFAVLEGCGGK